MPRAGVAEPRSAFVGRACIPESFAEGGRLEVTARRSLAAKGIQAGDRLSVERRLPVRGDVVLLGGANNTVRKIRIFDPEQARLLGSAEGLSLIGVVVALYRSYAIEESAHGPS